MIFFFLLICREIKSSPSSELKSDQTHKSVNEWCYYAQSPSSKYNNNNKTKNKKPHRRRRKRRRRQRRHGQRFYKILIRYTIWVLCVTLYLYTYKCDVVCVKSCSERPHSAYVKRRPLLICLIAIEPKQYTRFFSTKKEVQTKQKSQKTNDTKEYFF